MHWETGEAFSGALSIGPMTIGREAPTSSDQTRKHATLISIRASSFKHYFCSGFIRIAVEIAYPITFLVIGESFLYVSDPA